MDGLFQKIRQNTVVILLLLTGAVYFFLKYLSPLLSPVLMALLFVSVFGPLLWKLKEKFHIHRQLGALLLLVFFLAVTAVFLWMMGGWMWKSVPFLQQKVDVWRMELPKWAVGIWDDIISTVRDGENQFQRGMLSLCISCAGKAAYIGGYFVTFLIAVILLAKDYDELMNRLLDREDCRMILEVFCSVIRYIATWVRAQGIIMSITAGICCLVLTLSGIPQGICWGLLAGILDALPFIGTGVVLIPLGIFQVLEGSCWKGAVCVLLYGGCIISRQLMEPRLIGKRMGVKPVVVLISLYAGIQLFGVTGIIKGPLGFVIVYETWQYLMGEKTQKPGINEKKK